VPRDRPYKRESDVALPSLLPRLHHRERPTPFPCTLRRRLAGALPTKPQAVAGVFPITALSKEKGPPRSQRAQLRVQLYGYPRGMVTA
jgi:hypothetical protein